MCNEISNYTYIIAIVQSWFETEKQTADTEGITAEDSPQEAAQPSVPTGTDEDSRCQVCHDTFEQFYNEEKEEWHLRPAINFEGKNYHPLCLDDYKVGFVFLYTYFQYYINIFSYFQSIKYRYKFINEFSICCILTKKNRKRVSWYVLFNNSYLYIALPDNFRTYRYSGIRQ